ncbi:MAG: Non-ribosomal peptide synthetase, partial [Myxococcaceae bacterium]|nr:Non-ribosomal peptide synthetase [Myxococcaceae bacterium]
ALRQHGEPHYELSIFDAEEPASDAPADVAFDLHDAKQPQLVSYTQLSAAQLEAIDRALATFAGAALAQPHACIAELPLLDDSQRRTVLYDWNTTAAADLSSAATLPGMFSVQARRTPHARAVRHGQRSLSYKELDELSDALAASLHEANVLPGARVLVSLPHGLELVIAFLGVMKARASYVPVDPDAPVGRRETILATATPAMTLCETGARELWLEHTPCLSLDTLARHASRSSAKLGHDADDVACVIFTSGSTGVPKGVEVLQRGLLNHALAMSRLYKLAPGDRVLCTASVGFDVCGEQIYPALLAGAEVVMRPSDVFDSLTRFESFVRSAEITTLILPAGFWHEWMHALEIMSTPLPPSLRVVCVGSEKVLARHVHTFDRITEGKVQLFQGYGPTEATITCTLYQHTPGALREGEDMPIGRPIANVQMYVLDARMMPVPMGIVGDLYVAGEGLARGYLAAPALTAERFVANPFVAGTCMYKTGDRARYREDGQLVFLGREDSQIKLRGFRVELAEIEAVLAGCSGVSECVVLLAQPDDAPARLVAYVVRGASTPELTIAGLRSHLEQHLPAYMVPSDWLFLDTMPRTLNHKIDRAALPEVPVVSDRGRQRATGSPLEQTLCALVARLFPGRSVLPDDDFFRDLGGDSLLAIRLIAGIEAEHKVALSLSDFARDATVRALAKRLSGTASAGPSADYLTIQAGEQDKRPPLWLLPAVGGHVLYGEQLRRSMDPAQTVFGLDAPGLRESEQPLTRIEALADFYLRTILRVQPHGPYVIAGPSLGGLAAWQIACQLARQGESRVVVVLLDTWGPGYPRVVGPLQRLLDQAGHVLRQPSLSALWSLVLDRVDRRVRTWSGVPRYTVADHIEGVCGERIREVVRCAQIAAESYCPPPFAGHVLLFRATRNGHSSGVRFSGNDNGWGALLNPERARVVPVATHHQELSDRPPALIGERLQELLDGLAVESSAPAPPQMHNHWTQSQVHEHLAPLPLLQAHLN